MIKRFYSKRSGFTLAEIIVAFAVFAIMASMIAQILDLSVKARLSNNLYARQLAQQEKMLTVIQKSDSAYNDADKTGDYNIKFADDLSVSLGYQIKASDPTLGDQAEGINFFVSPVDYTCAPGDDGGTPSLEDGGSGSGVSQVSRMDTRISGTGGIGKITFNYVIKDEYAYPDDSPFKLEPGHTRYFFEVAADHKNIANDTVLLKQEDVGYSQYRLFFFTDEQVKTGGFTDEAGKKYSKISYKEAPIVEVGHIDDVMGVPGGVEHTGLSASNTSSGLDIDKDKNPYTVQALGNNSVRIGSPFDKNDDGTYGTRFKGAKPARFYVEFIGDPKLTTKSFGHNYTLNGAGDPVYTACLMYKETYNDDGTPKYEKESESTHPSIYGAYLFSRDYDVPAE